MPEKNSFLKIPKEKIIPHVPSTYGVGLSAKRGVARATMPYPEGIKTKIIIISGPTASGKSALALKLAETKNISIVNADALQIYQGLPILSAQPKISDCQTVKHFLYSYLQPQQNSSVAIWLQLVKSAVQDIIAQKKLPVLVGGSGMYISKLTEGISEIPEIEPHFKEEARRFYEEYGADSLRKKITALSGEAPNYNDKQRLIRAYEVLKQTGKSIIWWQFQPLKKIFLDMEFIHVNIAPERKILYENCNRRFEKMLQNGALQEVTRLLEQGIGNENEDKTVTEIKTKTAEKIKSEIGSSLNNNSQIANQKNFSGQIYNEQISNSHILGGQISGGQITKTLGFYEIRDFLQHKISYEKMTEIATQKTRNYAKRQLTWFRHQLPQKHVFNDLATALNFLKNAL
jgi:tRNA dimethylallyltransferase